MGNIVFLWASFKTSAIPRYTALKPHMIPTIPVIVLKVIDPDSTGLCVKSLIASMKNRSVKLENTNCNARLAFNVPKNIAKVKIPHIMKYAAVEGGEGALKPVNFGRIKSKTRLHQKRP